MAAIAIRFLATWLFYLAWLVVVALLVDINWARPVLQRSLAESLHRHVSLGKLSWTFGLDGIAVDTKELVILEPSGEPFMTAGESEIGIALLPLLDHRLLIRHLDFKKPELWMMRESTDRWNFTDLLSSGQEIRFIRFEDGNVHVIDKSGRKAQWRAFDLEHVKLEFVFPRKKNKAPFYLSCKCRCPHQTSSLQITGLQTGRHELWQQNSMTFKVKLNKFQPDDWREFQQAIAPKLKLPMPKKQKGGETPHLDGLFDLAIDGSGVAAQAINATAKAEIEKFKFSCEGMQELQADKAIAQAQLDLQPDKLAWHALTFTAGDLDLASDGQLLKWQGEEATYNTRIAGKVKDLKLLGHLIPSNFQQNAEHWSGHADIELLISGSKAGSRTETRITAEDIKPSDLLERMPTDMRSLLSLVELSEDARVKGVIHIGPDERFEIKDSQLQVGSGVVHSSGFADLKSGHSVFSFNANDLPLARLQKGVNDDLVNRVSRGEIALPRGKSVKLGGSFDLSGEVETQPGKQAIVNAKLSLRKADVKLSDGSFAARDLEGGLAINHGGLVFDHLSGFMGGGKFSLDGSVSGAFARSAQLNLSMEMKSSDMQHLSELLKIMKVQLPILSEKQLYGKVRQLSLNITGTRESPAVSLSAVPEDLYYKPPGLARPLRAKAGLIVYEHDRLTLTSVPLIMHNDQVTTDLVIEHLSNAAKLDHVKYKTAGVDLGDVHYYLSSTLMPPPLKKLYTNFLTQYKLAALHGRIYGDMLANLQNNDVLLDGALGLLNVGAKVAEENFPVEKLNGTLAATGNELLIQDLSGAIRNSKFDLSGHIVNYRSDHPAWKTQLRAFLDPKELLELLPAMSAKIEQWHLKFTALAPLELKADVNGDAAKNTVIFALVADPNDSFAISGPFGALHQPGGERLTLDGNVTLTPESATLSGAHLNIGSSLVNAAGTMLWHRTGKSELSSDDILHSQLKLKVETPNPIPARRLILAVNPSLNRETIKGTIVGDLNVTGTVEQPLTEGKLNFAHVNLPATNVDVGDVSGELLLKEPKADRSQTAQLTLSGARIRRLPVSNLVTEISISPPNGSFKQPKLTITNGTFNAAGGTVNLNGWLDLNDGHLSLNASLAKLKSAVLADELFNYPGEISGLMDGTINIQMDGNSRKQWLSDLSGSGHITVTNGTISRFGHLQTKLTQANLLHAGLFGFNLNNLLRSLYPVRTGQFHDLSSEFQIDKGIINVDHIRYNGDDMRLWAAGKVSLPLSTIQLEVAGKVPRVAASVLGGPVGEVSRAITVQKFVNMMTLHQLESLPSLPVLGELASDKPRTFIFKVVAQLDKPKMLAQSIEKSFHWMPSKPAATAHPVPGLR